MYDYMDNYTCIIILSNQNILITQWFLLMSKYRHDELTLHSYTTYFHILIHILMLCIYLCYLRVYNKKLNNI